jgi:cytochrome b561
MQLKNSTSHFGIIAIVLHWLMALSVFFLFSLGWWMTGLDYYDSWYKIGPWWHKSMGVILFGLLILRFFWRLFTPPPQPLTHHKAWEIKVAHWVHLLLYLLLLMTMLNGYLISTADNRPIEVFGWFSIPATITSIPNQADVAGWVHLILASFLLGLALLHAAAALKHHYIDRDNSLKRIFGR